MRDGNVDDECCQAGRTTSSIWASSSQVSCSSSTAYHSQPQTDEKMQENVEFPLLAGNPPAQGKWQAALRDLRGLCIWWVWGFRFLKSEMGRRI